MTKAVDIGTDRAEPYVAGDYLQLLVTVKDEDGAVVDLTNLGAARYRIAFKRVSSFSAVVDKTLGDGITVSDAENGQLLVVLANGDTEGLQGALIHELEITDAAGRTTTVLRGLFEVTRAALA